MGLFTPKPDRATQAEYMKQANNAVNIFGVALQRQVTTPSVGQEPIDLTVQENRDAIRDELTRIIREYGLEGCTEMEIGGVRLVPLSKDGSKSSLTDAALCAALAMNSINGITRHYYELFPKYQPFLEMVDNLAKICCPGAAQTIGPDLPPEAARTWPYFSQMFEEAKQAKLLQWPEAC